ncbi:uncharacterized protein LOC132723482 isoform X3 [Ruditapes philippinarum]|uniref:uncharacterized protein LOC132723482 isoform X3 n=1 Tax=Ruditapes philippinarum TaxID=129788 RepID=UPI00295A9A29|nr:uncharacterized protein LOC132723482 isoform X3 [Ruditapes philippinarum]
MEYFHTNDGFILPVLFLLVSAYGTPVNETHAKILCRDDAFIDCKLADEAHNICAIRTLAAVKLCPKYCGFCTADGSTLPPPTGTTIDTCVDSGDLDCKQMNDTLHLCAKKDSPPTLLYCPKFCGLCMPSDGGNTKSASTTSVTSTALNCRDEIYIDCKLADDSHNICAERIPAAVKFCQKYCGYCTVYGSTLPTPMGTETCIDSGDIDCKEMNENLNICAMKDDPPTLLYCPKFCGLCTPSSGANESNHVTSTISNVFTSSQSSQTTQTKTTQMTSKSSTIQSTTTSPPPKTLPPTTTQCAVCSGPPFLCEKLFQPTACTPPNNYCINTITNKLDGTRTVNRACGDFNTCYREWYLGTSDEDKCRNFDATDQQFIDFRCTFCCISDNCNKPLRPLNSDLYKPV